MIRSSTNWVLRTADHQFVFPKDPDQTTTFGTAFGVFEKNDDADGSSNEVDTTTPDQPLDQDGLAQRHQICSGNYGYRELSRVPIAWGYFVTTRSAHQPGHEVNTGQAGYGCQALLGRCRFLSASHISSHGVLLKGETTHVL